MIGKRGEPAWPTLWAVRQPRITDRAPSPVEGHPVRAMVRGVLDATDLAAVGCVIDDLPERARHYLRSDPGADKDVVDVVMELRPAVRRGSGHDGLHVRGRRIARLEIQLRHNPVARDGETPVEIPEDLEMLLGRDLM